MMILPRKQLYNVECLNHNVQASAMLKTYIRQWVMTGKLTKMAEPYPHPIFDKQQEQNLLRRSLKQIADLSEFLWMHSHTIDRFARIVDHSDNNFRDEVGELVNQIEQTRAQHVHEGGRLFGRLEAKTCNQDLQLIMTKKALPSGQGIGQTSIHCNLCHLLTPLLSFLTMYFRPSFPALTNPTADSAALVDGLGLVDLDFL